MDESREALGNQEQSLDLNFSASISCTTFNILAPIYKRLNDGSCEGDFRDIWVSRNEQILDRLLHLKSQIICLQEFWLSNDELVSMYEKQLGDAGYATYELARTNDRGDGLLTAVHKNHFRVLNYREFLFNDIGDRVVQLLHVELLVNFSQNESGNIKKEALLVNTHLIFPHDSSYCFLRLQQVYKILQYIDSYRDEYELPPIPIILCGDWNGSKKGNVCKFLRSQGFVSSYDIANHCNDNGEDSDKWISHRNHRGNVCGVDFVWLLNPDKHCRPLKESFLEAVLGNIKDLLHKVSGEDVDLQHIFKTDGRHITYLQFFLGLTELGVCGHSQDSLSNGDLKDLWDHLDTDRNGIVDLSHFDLPLQGTRNVNSFLQQKEDDNKEQEAQMKQVLNASNSVTTIGFKVNRAMLFPPEVEKGMWPDNYSLSDHALLTVEFLPVKVQSS